MNTSLLNKSLLIIALISSYTTIAQTKSDVHNSSNQEVYLLPNGKVLPLTKFDSLENAWGKGRISFQHSTDDDAKGIIHLVQVTDEMMQKYDAKKNAEAQAFDKMLNTLAPDFDLRDVNGTTWSLNKLRGKIVVLNFWFTSCAPCIQEMPELNKLVNTYQNEEVVFLALTFNDKKQIEQFLRKRQFSYKLLPNSYEVDQKYQVSSWPVSLVIDKKGYIRMITKSSPNIREALEDTINKLRKQ